ncbi:MAG TPA: hypothetical protein VFV38_42675 [Ktedonobacteraceae bacterium]|nr:hypothetical protein [Ktedonobacteraceae bacterium]
MCGRVHSGALPLPSLWGFSEDEGGEDAEHHPVMPIPGQPRLGPLSHAPELPR